MKFTQLPIAGAWIIDPIVHGDARGYFVETFREDLFNAHVGHVDFVQDNESLSMRRGVLRGLHFQSGPTAQAKLVRVSQGEVVDVIVDLRKDSPTFGQHSMITLSAENHRQLFMPRGMAHGFVVMSDVAQFQYKVDNYYAPGSEHTLKYDDPTVGIKWPIAPEEMLLSDKDRRGLSFDEVKEII